MKKGWEEREVLCVIGKLWHSFVGYQTLVLFIIFELLLSTCKLNWILPSCTFCNSLPNSRFLHLLQYLVQIFKIRFPTVLPLSQLGVTENQNLFAQFLSGMLGYLASWSWMTGNLHAWGCCCVGYLGSLLQVPRLLCSVLENNMTVALMSVPSPKIFKLETRKFIRLPLLFTLYYLKILQAQHLEISTSFPPHSETGFIVCSNL